MMNSSEYNTNKRNYQQQESIATAVLFLFSVCKFECKLCLGVQITINIIIIITGINDWLILPLL